MNDVGNGERPKMRERGLVIQEAADEILVYDLATNKAHCLNHSAAAVWRLCDGNKSVKDISAHFKSSANDNVSEDFVWLAIDQLAENDLLESATLHRRFNGMSRRKAIKSIGLATAMALPVVASLVAPQNALATGSCACVVPADCAAQMNCPSTINCNPSGVCAP